MTRRTVLIDLEGCLSVEEIYRCYDAQEDKKKYERATLLHVYGF